MRWFGLALFSGACLALLPAATPLAAVHTLHFQGRSGPGLLAGNVTTHVPVNAGSGGVLGMFLYNDVSNQLLVSFGWGSGNGFADLSGDVTRGALHGPALAPAPDAFSQTADVFLRLDDKPGWRPSARSGRYFGSVIVPQAFEDDLLAGSFYLSIATAANPDGELRGNLIAAPEPATYVSMLAGLLVLAVARFGTARFRARGSSSAARARPDR